MCFIFFPFTAAEDVFASALRLRYELGPEKEVTVSRSRIMESVLAAYRDDPELIHYRLKVVFSGEEIAEDLDGPTREMFTHFFKEIIDKCFVGECNRCAFHGPSLSLQ